MMMEQRQLTPVALPQMNGGCRAFHHDTTLTPRDVELSNCLSSHRDGGASTSDVLELVSRLLVGTVGDIQIQANALLQ